MNPKLLLLDNFDSFTYNLQHYAVICGFEVIVKRNTLTVQEVEIIEPQAILLSPGPSSPNESGNMMKILSAYAGKIPIIGICLGHQAIGLYLGFTLQHAIKPMHGKVSEVEHTNHPLFHGVSNPFRAMRYHSLIIEAKEEISNTDVLCKTSHGEIMGIYNQSLLLCGLQFHPESIETPSGLQLLQNWKDLNFR